MLSPSSSRTWNWFSQSGIICRKGWGGGGLFPVWCGCGKKLPCLATPQKSCCFGAILQNGHCPLPCSGPDSWLAGRGGEGEKSLLSASPPPPHIFRHNPRLLLTARLGFSRHAEASALFLAGRRQACGHKLCLNKTWFGSKNGDALGTGWAPGPLHQCLGCSHPPPWVFCLHPLGAAELSHPLARSCFAGLVPRQVH